MMLPANVMIHYRVDGNTDKNLLFQGYVQEQVFDPENRRISRC